MLRIDGAGGIPLGNTPVASFHVDTVFRISSKGPCAVSRPTAPATVTVLQPSTVALTTDCVAELTQLCVAHCGDPQETIGNLMTIGQLLNKTPRMKSLLALAEGFWGRDTIFDETSKLLLVCQRAGTPREAIHCI